MITKHFFNTLLIFSVMIILGLAGVFLVEHLEREKGADKAGGDSLIAK